MTMTDAPTDATTHTTSSRSHADREPGERLVEHRTHRGQLMPLTDAGRRLVATADALTEPLAAAAVAHDRDRSFPFDAIEAVRRTGLPWAAAPEHVGGWELSSVHDLIVGSSRLARANPSLTIGLNMHLLSMDLLAHRGRCDAVERDAARRARIGVERIARQRLLMASAISEHAQDLVRPRTRATRIDDGWIVDGRKAFCTMSPAADLLTVAVAYRRADGQERIGFAQLPRTAPGITIEDDWDALGMRSSGSHSVTFDQVRVESGQIQDAFPFGHADRAWLDRYLTSGLGHAAATLGVAEAAHAVVTGAGPDRRAARANDPRALMSAAENAVDLAAMRATLAAAALGVDRYRERVEAGERVPTADLSEELASTQRAKAFVDRTAVRVVDRALELSGGAGYLDAHPLSRAWRDVRAGAFMHPYGANRGYAIVGAIELGEEPKLG